MGIELVYYNESNNSKIYVINYTDIAGKDICIITEAEKGVMQLDSMKLPYGLGLCVS